MGFAEETIYDFEYDNNKYYYIRRSKPDKVVVEKDDHNKNKYIAVYKCNKCKGTGQVHWLRDNGICYDCGGRGFHTVRLNPTKNIQVAENRLNKIKTDKENKEKNFLKDNMRKTLETYSNEFYIILNDEKSTFEEREYLKSLGAKWNSFARCWTIRVEYIKGDELKGFKTFKYKTLDVLNEYNVVDTDILNKDITKWAYRDE